MILLNLSEIIVVTPSLHRTLCKSDLYKTPKAIVIASSWSIWAIKIEKITSVNIFWGRSFSCENFRGVCRLAFSHALYVLSLKPSQNLPLEILKSAKSAGGGTLAWKPGLLWHSTICLARCGAGLASQVHIIEPGQAFSRHLIQIQIKIYTGSRFTEWTILVLQWSLPMPIGEAVSRVSIIMPACISSLWYCLRIIYLVYLFYLSWVFKTARVCN